MTQPSPSVLFICTANRCRSVAAAGLWQKRLAELAADVEQWKVSSAGTWAEDGKPPLPGLYHLLRRRGIDVEGIRSRRLTRELLLQHRLALVMEPGQKEGIEAEFPEMRGKVFLLSEMAGLRAAVPDPAGDSPDAYADCLLEISTYLRMGERRILALARGDTYTIINQPQTALEHE
jgi:protein-tyrosine phosphatase